MEQTARTWLHTVHQDDQLYQTKGIPSPIVWKCRTVSYKRGWYYWLFNSLQVTFSWWSWLTSDEMVSATLFCNFKFIKILKQQIQKYLQFLVCCEPHNIFMHKITVHLSWFTELYTGMLLMCPTEGKRKMYSLVGYIIIFKLIFNFIIYNYLAHPLKSCKMFRNTCICSEFSTTP